MDPTTDEDRKHRRLISALSADRQLAHRVLFPHRHPDPTPPFHNKIIDVFHGPSPRALVLAFRGGGKSTIFEEGTCIKAGLREFQNCLIIGESYERACERLFAIRHEIDSNEHLVAAFGELRGPVWTENRLVLSTNIQILALGRGQSLRGTKHLDQRPDFWWGDDIEDEVAVGTHEQRQRTLRWFFSVLRPAINPKGKGRIAATPLDRQSLVARLPKEGGWPEHVYPIEYMDEAGNRTAIWPERFPLEVVDQLRAEYAAMGLLERYNQEYLCRADSPDTKTFSEPNFIVRPRTRTWEATYAMFDPARTTGAKSASTGWAVWSWLGNRLIVWDAGADMYLPDEIVAKIFAVDEEYSPVQMNVEKDGLNEWLMQPLRHEAVKRGRILPLKGRLAPRGKLDFIAALKPLFDAREIEFAKDLPDLKAQFLNFPKGRIDAPNALAYALLYRPGLPVYDGFNPNTHIMDEIRAVLNEPVWLALNSTGAYTTGVLAQLVQGSLRIIQAWIMDGDPGQSLRDMVTSASLEAAQSPCLVAPPAHFHAYSNIGLVQAVRRIPAEVRRGVEPGAGRPHLRERFERLARGLPAIMVSAKARWVLNALASGYARSYTPQGKLSTEADDTVYKTLMEGLESFAGLMQFADLGDEPKNWATTRSGIRYQSALPNAQPAAAAKSDWHDMLKGETQMTARRR